MTNLAATWLLSCDKLGQLHYRAEALPLDLPTEAVDLPPLSRTEILAWERRVLGLPTGEHVLTFYRDWLAEQGILGSRELASQLITLEDEAGLIDLILRPQVYTRYRRLLRNEPLLVAEGPVQQQEGVTNLLVERLTPLPRL